MVTHLDISDGRYVEAAAAILRRYDNFEAEANITTAVRDFLILSGLAVGDEIIEENLLRAALGEIAREPAELDDLFIRHTYLSLVIGMAVPASFGIDLRQVAETDPSDLLQGRRFRDATGLRRHHRIGPLRLPRRGGRTGRDQSVGPPDCAVRLDQRSAGHRGHPLRDGHTARGTAHPGRILHSGVPGTDDGAGVD